MPWAVAQDAVDKLVADGLDQELMDYEPLLVPADDALCLGPTVGSRDRPLIREAAKRGIFAYITDGEDPNELQ
jgi:hypothetical protein